MATYLISKCEDEVWRRRRSGDIFPSEVEEADFWCPLSHGNTWNDGVECPHLLIKFLPWQVKASQPTQTEVWYGPLSGRF